MVPTAANCRFELEILFETSAASYDFFAVFGDAGDRSLLFSYPVGEVRRRWTWLQRLAGHAALQPVPDPELIYVTQGGRNQQAYRDSIVGSLFNLRRYLEATGIDFDAVESVLDFGCGTGRLLLGWFLDRPSRRLTGCDRNGELISWAQRHLLASMVFARNDLRPPLADPPRSLDLILVSSVFTHLSLELQRAWAAEFHRLLRPRGHLLVTLHGPIYARLLGGAEALARLEADGYLESPAAPEGSNQFVTFHSSQYARRFLPGFDLVASFPEGRIGGTRPVFPVASLQDVYLYRNRFPE